MKHAFDCGITATSHDSLGDEFLSGMIRQRDLEDGPTEAELLCQRVRQLEASERQARLLVASLVQKVGGSVEIDDMETALAYDLVVYRDESKRGVVLKTRLKS